MGRGEESPEEARSELIRALSDPALLRALCHDLRGPLGAIGTWAHVLRSGQADAATQRRALAAILADVAAQGRLLDQLGDLSSIADGSLVPVLETVELLPLLGGMGATLESDLKSPTVLADPNLLRRLLQVFLPPREASDQLARVLVAERDERNVVALRGTTPHGAPGALGLTMATALAHLQDGQVSTSPAPHGTTFTIRLPAAP
jgi:signal transduction histidine kinase